VNVGELAALFTRSPVAPAFVLLFVSCSSGVVVDPVNEVVSHVRGILGVHAAATGFDPGVRPPRPTRTRSGCSAT